MLGLLLVFVVSLASSVGQERVFGRAFSSLPVSGGVHHRQSVHHGFPNDDLLHHEEHTAVHQSSMHPLPQQPDPLPDTCKSNSRSFHVDQYHYQFFDCLLPWESARAVCRSSMSDSEGQYVPGGDLVTVKDEEENQWLLEYAQLTGFGSYYNGLRFWSRGEDGQKCTEDDKFVWGSGYDFSYRNFDKEKPRCSGGKKKRQNCVATQADGSWDDVACNLPLRFVCKAYRYPTIQYPSSTIAHHRLVQHTGGHTVGLVGAEGNQPFQFDDDYDYDYVPAQNADSPLPGHRGPFSGLDHFNDYYNKIGEPKTQ